MDKEKSEVIKAILEFIQANPNGVSFDEICKRLTPSLSEIDLKRLLDFLMQAGKVFVLDGSYKITGKNAFSSYADQDRLIPLSKASEEIEKIIMQPMQKRSHVSYNRDFLEDYEPNVTYYLSSHEREMLKKIGSSQEEKRPAGTYAKKIFNRLLIDLSWNSSRLEGNTYSLLETEQLLQCNEPSLGKDLQETQMILNHKEAIEFLIRPSIRLDRFTIMNLHALLSHNLLKNPLACGKLREIPVEISSTVYVPLGLPQVIEECFAKIIYTACKIKDPFEKSFFLMVHLPYLQPFEDVNKRVSRLTANIPLIQENVCPLSFVDVPKEDYIRGLLGIYELNQVSLMKDIFIWAYNRSCSLYAATKQSLGEPDPFRLVYRKEITQTIQEIVQAKMNKKEAHAFIEKQKGVVPQDKQEKFIEVVETELISLHEGNIARYKIHLEKFKNWQSSWM